MVRARVEGSVIQDEGGTGGLMRSPADSKIVVLGGACEFLGLLSIESPRVACGLLLCLDADASTSACAAADGEHVKGQESTQPPIKRTESEMREVADELAPLKAGKFKMPQRMDTGDSTRSIDLLPCRREHLKSGPKKSQSTSRLT